jgi:multidrug efflux system membrane fusion protein
MEQQQNGRTASDAAALGRSFEGQGSPNYGGDLGLSFVDHNSSPGLWVDPQKKSHLWIWITVAVAIVIAFILIHVLTTPKEAPAGGSAPGGAAAGRGRGQQGTAAITTGESRTGDINVYDQALGTVTPVNTVTLYSQITGKIMAVHYKEGQLVHQGQPLVEIDPRPYQATLGQAKGTLQRDQGVLAQAKIDLDRYRAAYTRNAIAKQQLDDQEQVVIQDEGTVQTDLATVEYDEVQLSYTHIASPISGRVGLRLVDPGNTIFSGSSSTLAVITQLQPITVVFNVSEDSLPQVQAETKKNRSLVVDAYDRSNDNLIEVGRLTSLDNQIDTTTGTLKFRAAFPNHNYALFPNQFVNARLLVKTLFSVVLIPTAAVQHNGLDAFVYLVSQAGNPGGGSKVTKQSITVLNTDEKEAAVSGIQSGVTLATSGFDRLENGAEVQVHSAGQGGGKAARANDTASPPSTGHSAETSGNKAP